MGGEHSNTGLLTARILSFSLTCARRAVWVPLWERAWVHITHHLLHTHFLYADVGILQLKDGGESEVNRATFTVELHVRTVCVNGAEQRRCTAYTVLRVLLCFGGLRVTLVRNDIGHGGCVTCQCGSFLWQVYCKSHFYALLLFPVSHHLTFFQCWASLLSTTACFSQLHLKLFILNTKINSPILEHKLCQENTQYVCCSFCFSFLLTLLPPFEPQCC